ncbi:outer membrane protein assembly factor BamC [Candidatus Hartigia pinicola]
MLIFLKQLNVMKISSLLFIFLVTACSSEERYKHQINSNEDYLDADPLKALHIPHGVTLPLKNKQYDLPKITSSGPVGQALDIYPPELIN